MSEILFGQSYFLGFDPKLAAAMQPYPPLGALYAASYLRAQNYQVALFDAMLAQSEDEWTRALDHHAPRFAILYEDSFNYLSKMCLLRMRAAAFTMIRAAHARGCIVIVSGSDATDHLAEYFDAGANFILIGEGEITLGELLATLTERAPRDLNTIRGLAFRDARGAIARTPPREFVRDLDTLPFPAWDLVDMARYRDAWRARHGYFSMNLVTTRGCPYHCNWCAKPIYGQRYNSRSPENVVAEMQLLKEKYQPDHIEFADDIFGLKPGWLARFADRVVAQDARIPFKCLMRADLVTDATTSELQRAGCRLVWMGAESGSQKILDAMEKGTRVEHIRAATERLHRANIQVGFFLQFGYPSETRADIEQTLQMVRDCAPDDIGISVAYPLPGTPFHARVKQQLGDQQNWNDSADLAMMYRGPYSTAFYRQLHSVAHKEFRAHQAGQTLRRKFSIKTIARWFYNRLTLPFARARLEWLARAPHHAIRPSAPALSPQAAARPTPQND
ncbi:MAG: B12-binding domain-containing radical SAM protein [Chloroflexi bacterium]|nr:B12-binding domain-containing radical SAM protein [Chloroflexota bacterium]